MADNPDDDSSSFQRTVILREWWLIKCSKEFEGKRFGVAGTQLSDGTRAVRVFTSSPIIKAFDVFTLQASDGVCIILRGFLNKQRLVLSGFLPQISRDFIFGFPPCWEAKLNRSFVGVPSGATFNSVIDKASRTIISPCNNTKWNLEDTSPAVVEKNTQEISDKVGSGGGSVARDQKPARKRSLRLQSKSVQVKNKTTNDGSEGLSKAKSGGLEVDEGNERRKLDKSKVKKRTNGGDHVSEGLDKDKTSDVDKDNCEVINSQVVSPADGCGKKGSGADNVDKVTSMTATEESLGKGELEATEACKDSEKSGKKAVSKKSGKALTSDGNVVEHVSHSGTEVNRKLDVCQVQNPTTNDVGHGKAKGNGIKRDECMDNEEISPLDGCGKMHSGTNSKKITTKNATKESEHRKGKLKVKKTSLHSLPKEASDSSKNRKNGKSKRSEKILKGDLDVVERMTHSRSKVKDNLSMGKTIRKINFDEEVTPDKGAKKQKTNAESAGSLGQRRSRSGRVLVSPLEYWRNQVAVYDVDRNLIQVNERRETNSTPSKSKGSVSRKPRRMKVK